MDHRVLIDLFKGGFKGPYATPGPSFSPDVTYMGQNLRFAYLAELPADMNSYLELPCFDTPEISRLAVNLAKQTLVTVAADSGVITEIEHEGVKEFAERMDKGESKMALLEELKRVSNVKVSTVEAFPAETALINWNILPTGVELVPQPPDVEFRLVPKQKTTIGKGHKY